MEGILKNGIQIVRELLWKILRTGWQIKKCKSQNLTLQTVSNLVTFS